MLPAGCSPKMDPNPNGTPLDSVNSPDLDKGENLRAITSAAQAWNISKKLKKDNIPRNNTNAEVQRHYNGRRPFSPAALKADNQGWRNNFSSRAFASVVNKCIPSPISLFNSSPYLTASKLNPKRTNAEEKSSRARDLVTRTIRGWENWGTFQWKLWKEVILHGGAFAVHLHRYSPWPRVFKLNEGIVPPFTGQSSKEIQVINLEIDWLIHEFVEQVKNPETAGAAGWDIKAAEKALRDCLPLKATDGNTLEDRRKYEDLIREGNLGASMEGSKAVKMSYVLAVEPQTKKVSYYGLNREGEHEALIHKDDAFPSMEETVAMFALEPGTFYESIGLGKNIVNACIALERNRCRMLDQLKIAGLPIVKTDATKSPTIQTRMQHPFILVAADGEISQEQIAANIEAYTAADNALLRWIEQAAGAYITDLRGPDDNPTTATEEKIREQNQSQQRAAFLARAAEQHAKLITNWQKRLLDPETQDPIAKELQRALKEDVGMDAEEIEEFRNSPVAEVVNGTIEVRNAKIITACQALAGNPNFDQYILDEIKATAMVDPDFTKAVMLPEANVQANEIEANRLQLMENEDMLAGAPMGVSPRDLHPSHLDTLISEMRTGIPNIIAGDTKSMDGMNLMLHHGMGHVQEMQKAGAKPAETQPYVDKLKKFDELLTKAAEQHRQQNQLAAQGPPPGTMQVPHGPGSMNGEVAPGVGAPFNPPPAAPLPEPPSASDLVKMYVAPDTPAEIKVQIERKLGLTPSTVEQHQATQAANAVEKHPDLPSKIPPSSPAPQNGPPPVDMTTSGANVS